MKVLVTGAAGFIGFHLVNALVRKGDFVIGLDNINEYYDANLKYSRLEAVGIQKNEIAHNSKVQSNVFSNYQFILLSLEDRPEMFEMFEKEKFDVVVNLAAQAGVRYSIENPFTYADSNIVGFLNVLEGSKRTKVKHLVFASSSSVYGLNKQIPFSTENNTDHPVSLYAATKKSNELMAHTYSHLYSLPTTGLRFFTVYGPWGRPDMAYMLFTKAILNNQPIKVFNFGKMSRDFTYVGDIVEGIVKVMNRIPVSDESWSPQSPSSKSSSAPYKIYNIGNQNPINLMDFIETIEDELGIKSSKKVYAFTTW